MILEKDLTIKFTNPEVLFDYRSAEITPKFSMILSEFIPQYLAIITKEKYKDSISECFYITSDNKELVYYKQNDDGHGISFIKKVELK